MSQKIRVLATYTESIAMRLGSEVREIGAFSHPYLTLISALSQPYPTDFVTSRQSSSRELCWSGLFGILSSGEGYDSFRGEGAGHTPVTSARFLVTDHHV